MPFSSSEWTIPEILVWDLKGKLDGISHLTHRQLNSLWEVEAAVPGVWARRHKALSWAQEGLISMLTR
jgi:hypothetical protein